MFAIILFAAESLGGNPVTNRIPGLGKAEFRLCPDDFPIHWISASARSARMVKASFDGFSQSQNTGLSIALARIGQTTISGLKRINFRVALLRISWNLAVPQLATAALRPSLSVLRRSGQTGPTSAAALGQGPGLMVNSQVLIVRGQSLSVRGRGRCNLSLQGAVVASYRRRGTKRTGPYYLMTCRDQHGRQCSVYLGPESPLVQKARNYLATLQRPLRTQRSLRGARRAVRRQLAAARADLARDLAGSVLYLKGAEIRGWSQLSAPFLFEAASLGVDRTRAAEPSTQSPSTPRPSTPRPQPPGR